MIDNDIHFLKVVADSMQSALTMVPIQEVHPGKGSRKQAHLVSPKYLTTPT
jgi:hypothetical protein